MSSTNPQRPAETSRFLGQVGLVLGLLLLLLPAPALASAALPGPAEWEQERRTIEAVPTADGFSFRSTRDTEHGQDDLIGNFHRSLDQFQLGMVSREPAAQLLVNVTFVSFYEFRDLDENGGYSVGDEITGRMRLKDIPRSAVLTEIAPLLDGGYIATVTYPLASPASTPAAPGTFTIRFHIIDTPRTIGATDSVPTAVLVELIIEDYPFRANGTLLALETRADGFPALHIDKDGLRAAASPFEALIGWDSAAAQGTQSGAVHVAVVEVPSSVVTPGTQDQRSVLFSYPRSDASTVHLTSVGFRRPVASVVPDILEGFASGDWRVYSLAVAATVSLVGLSIWRRIRAA